MNRLKWICVSVFILFSSQSAWASFVFDVNAFYFTDDLTAGSDNSNASTLYNVFLGMDASKKGTVQLGWAYISHSTTDENTTTTEYSATQMGPGLVWFPGRGDFRIALAYLLVLDGEFSITSTEEWEGTAIHAELGYQFDISESSSLGVRINYNAASYNERLVGTTQTDVSYKKNLIYPSVAYTWMP